MDSITSEVLSKLKFIGKIQPTEKINVKYMYVQQDTWLTKFLRTIFSPDNRTNALTFFKSTIDKSFEILNANKDIPEKAKMVENIIRDVEMSTIGINNFKETYKHDLMFCCEIDTFIQSIMLRIDDIKQGISQAAEEEE